MEGRRYMETDKQGVQVTIIGKGRVTAHRGGRGCRTRNEVEED